MGCTQLSTAFLSNLPRHLASPQNNSPNRHLVCTLRGFLDSSVLKNLPANAGAMDSIPGLDDPLEEEMAPHFSTGKTHGQRSLAGYIGHGVPRSRTEPSMRMYTCTLYALPLALIYITKHFCFT